MKQLFIINQDRSRIYPLEKDLIHMAITVDRDGASIIQVLLAGLPLGEADSIKQANRIIRMIKNFEGRNGQAFHMPGYCNYNSKADWMELLLLYQKIENMEAAMDEMG